uniref:Protein-tyrosine-phosphatase n=1 Tax=Arcella intermedia TaxID=1963864 RepID=A0A6B2LJR0_9EUKA
MKDLSITHILNMTDEIPNFHEALNHFQYKKISFPDSEQGYLPDILDDALSFIDSAKAAQGRVLVHCRLGISRSASVVIGYLLRTTSKPLKAIWEDLRATRPIVKPNPSFLKQLMHLEATQHHLPQSTLEGPEVIWGKSLATLQWKYLHGEELF